MKGKTIAVIAIVIVVVVAGAATVVYLTQSKKPSIVFSGWVSSGAEYTFDKKMVDQFNALHPNVTVEFSPITGNYYSTLSTKFTANTAPAVFYMENDALPAYAKNGYIMDLTPYLTANTSYDLSGFVPTILHTFYYKGSVYAAPKDWGPLFVYYNKAIFNQEHVPYPNNLTAWNWTTMESTLQQLKANQSVLPNGGSGYYPMVVDTSFARVLPLMHEAGAEWINQNGTGAASNNGGLLSAIKFYYSLYTKGYAALSANLSAGWAGGDFATGKVAMIYSGGWTVPVLSLNGSWFQNRSSEIGYFHMPSDVQNGTMGFDVGLALNSKLTGLQKWIALQFLEYFTGPSGEQSWVSLGLALPARTSILDSSSYAAAHPILAYAGSSQASYTYGWAYNTTNFTAAESNAETIIANLFAGKATPVQAYQQILSETNSTLAGSSSL